MMESGMPEYLADPIAIAGSGNVGQALGFLLHRRGARVAAVAGRDAARAHRAAAFIGDGVAAVRYGRLPDYAADILIAVSDSAIESVAEELAGAMTRGTALHTCGARGPEALRALAARGVECGTIHLLQTVPSPERGVASIPGAAFAVGGSGPALAQAERIVRLLDGMPLQIAADARARYHAAAVIASNYVVGLVHAAASAMEAAGVTKAEALRAIAPLARASLENALREGPERALTGPVARGDACTVVSHLKALEDSPALRRLYGAAGRYLLEFAGSRELDCLLRDGDVQ
jgi:predicted short-subunit dehydrogenase-like oxidoreductase (DUF2520 family)